MILSKFLLKFDIVLIKSVLLLFWSVWEVNIALEYHKI